jgi:hypothetical protein
MNSIINLTSTDVNKSTVVVHKDGADFDVPVVNMFQTMAKTSPSYEYLVPVYEYSACISSSSSGLNVQKVIKNTLGNNVTFTRTAVGSYKLSCPDLTGVAGAIGVCWGINQNTWTTNFCETKFAIEIDGNAYASAQELGFIVYDITDPLNIIQSDDGFNLFLFEVKVFAI